MNLYHMLIYVITNKINGKQYVGQTVQQMEARWSMHKSGSSGCVGLKAAFEKYGSDNFTIEKICDVNSLEELSKMERKFIKELSSMSPNGYNLTTGGEQAIFSEATRKKMSESGKNRRPISDSTRKKLSERQMGAKNPNFGKKFTEEHRKKLSMAHLGNKSALKAKVL